MTLTKDKIDQLLSPEQLKKKDDGNGGLIKYLRSIMNKVKAEHAEACHKVEQSINGE